MGSPKYKSDAMEAIHSSAQALFRHGIIDKTTMREFDKDCLSPVPELAPKDILRLRKANKVSQPVFARYLGTSESTIEKMGKRCKAAQRNGVKTALACGEAWVAGFGLIRCTSMPPPRRPSAGWGPLRLAGQTNLSGTR
jgi:DNA-binding transcriptional regulator YiaG